jgi:hypothetical protein
MSDELKDILSNLNPDIDQEILLQYLQGKLTALQQHDLEMKMQDNEFTNDALEGLQNFGDKHKIALLVEQLNKDLKRRTDKKKKFREKLKLQLDPWVIVAVILILALVVISYLIIRKQMGK